MPVCNIPVLARILGQLNAAGIRSATVTLPNTGEHAQTRARNAAPLGFELDLFFSNSSFPGTAAMVRSLMRADDGTLLVIYGDSLLSVDFSRLVTSHRQARKLGGLASILCHQPVDIREVENDGRSLYGVLALGEGQRIARFLEKPYVEEVRPGFELANAAVFIIERELLEDRRFSGASDFSSDVFQPAINDDIAPIFGCDIGSGFRFDIGGLRRLYVANMDVLNRRVAAPVPGREEMPGVWLGNRDLPTSVRITPPVLIGNDVEFDGGAQIGPDVVLGERCHVGAGAMIRHAVVMEDCHLALGTTVEFGILGANCRVGPGVALPHFSAMDASQPTEMRSWAAQMHSRR